MDLDDLGGGVRGTKLRLYAEDGDDGAPSQTRHQEW
jgi:hypothetical protein